MYDIIEIDQWKRKELFNFYASYDNPTWDLMCDMRITSFYNTVKANEYSFFLAFLYVGSLTCNGIEELRCRIDDDGNVRRYHTVHPGSTILYDDGTFGFGYFNFQNDVSRFIAESKETFQKQKETKGVDVKDDDLARIYFSPIPWISFSGFRHPFRKAGNTSVPMIVFGKHYERDGERYMPVGLTLHHGLADGYHAGQFFTQLQHHLDHPDPYIKSK
ncbi:MAG: CatA-like O-acetyltransferase [Saprospiraceae bacterium]|nr:CatA-like O-acetyltransferase [Saprospiraceae bacterium]